MLGQYRQLTGQTFYERHWKCIHHWKIDRKISHRIIDWKLLIRHFFDDPNSVVNVAFSGNAVNRVNVTSIEALVGLEHKISVNIRFSDSACKSAQNNVVP